MRDLFSSLAQVGFVDWIGVSSARCSPIEALSSAALEVGTGITQDYHASSGKSKRQVTLIQAEHLDVIAKLLRRDELDPSLLRRNIVVSGINLLALRTCRFRIGAAELEGTGNCDPCSRMEENLGAGGWNAMRGHGGITAKVVVAGIISIGDEVAFLEALARRDSKRRS